MFDYISKPVTLVIFYCLGFTNNMNVFEIMICYQELDFDYGPDMPLLVMY